MIISPEHGYLQYSGRIDFTNPEVPVFVYPCTYVKMRFTGNILKLTVENKKGCWNNYLGYILDGVQDKIQLAEKGKETLEIPVDQSVKEHEILLFKRQDSCHTISFYGLEIENNAKILKVDPKPHRKIEVYGDSVSAGEVSEAIEYEGKEDPKHNGEYSNSWYSYAWMTARKLNAQIHNIAQGGIALLDGTGWFAPPEYMGIEKVYDKIEYNPELGAPVTWDFALYTPHVVIIAIGQNDGHPEDYMSEEPNGEKAKVWKDHYKAFVKNIREKYPKAFIILSTTILKHSINWDIAIDEVCNEIGDSNIRHFLYKRNGSGTPGHIRISEAEEMSVELSNYIQNLGDEIWNN